MKYHRLQKLICFSLILWAAVLGCSAVVFAGAAGWSPIQNLTPVVSAEGRNARDPDVFVDTEGVVHVVYRERDIFYLRSEDNGFSWSEAKKVSTTKVNQAPTIVADRDGIHVVWSSLEISPEHTHYQLFYSRSEDKGQTWTKPEQLTQFESSSTQPSLMATQNGLTLVWLPTEVATEYEEMLRSSIYFVESRSGGRTWGKPALIFEVLQSLEIFVPFQIDSDSFGVYWKDDQKIRVRITRDNGLTWAWDWKLEPFLDPLRLNKVVYTPETIYLLGINRDQFEANRLRLLNVNTLEEKFLTQPVIFRSPPQADYGNEEVHVSLSDEFNTWIAYLRTDGQPPNSWFTEPVNNEIATETFRIAWEGEDDISRNLTYSFLPHGEENWTSFDPGEYVVVQTPPDGEYTFQVRAKDEAGNIQPEPALLEFDTFSVPPNTTFEQPPPPQVFSRSVEVAWTAYDNTLEPEDLLYSYSLDEQPWTEFRKQTRQTFRDLLEGPHRLRVRSRDNRGNIDESPAEAGFEVIIGIQLAFKTKPASSLSLDRFSFSWTGSDETADNVPLYFAYRVDGGQWSDWSLSDTVALEDLAEGRHSFEVKARDDIGNEVTQPLVHEFNVDLTPPDTVASLDEVMADSDYAPVLSVGGTDNLTAQEQLGFDYRISGGEWQDAGKERSLVLDRSLGPWSVGFTVEVRARDEVGNVDSSPAVVDLTFPNRYFEYGFGTLGVSIIYPIIFVVLIVGVLLVFLGGVIFLFRRFMRKRKKPAEGEEDDFALADEKAAAEEDDEDDLFGDTDSDDDLMNMKFDDEDDDLFS